MWHREQAWALHNGLKFHATLGSMIVNRPEIAPAPTNPPQPFAIKVILFMIGMTLWVPALLFAVFITAALIWMLFDLV